MAVPGGTEETLDSVPAHVWKGLPEDLRLRPSAVNQSRIGVWASKLISKGRRFGPFLGEKKKRSQVTSNVYMWEVYFPAWGWMCVDATDPAKGNWLRYVNWARSTQEQNLFPLEINRAIYYKVLRPIRPGEELLVWYNGEDNPEIAAVLAGERASSLSKKKTHRAKRARRRRVQTAQQGETSQKAGQGGVCGAESITMEMRDSEGLKDEDERPSHSSELAEMAPPQPSLPLETEQNCTEKQQELNQGQSSQSSAEVQAVETEPVDQGSGSYGGPEVDDAGSPEQDPSPVASLPKPEPDAYPDFESEPRGESLFPCPHCERYFNTKQGLERHTHIHVTANLHTHTFKCRYCGKLFGSQAGRRRHERRHENGLKKRPGLFAGAVSSLSPSMQTDSSSPDIVAPPGHFHIVNSLNNAVSSQSEKREGVAEAERTFLLDESGESKELHPCKYCRKAFSSHTNMRRHQRRIHERHLLPKGVRRKGSLLQEVQAGPRHSAAPTGESPSTSPPVVYQPSREAEDEGDNNEEYIMDISNNISENLSLYIDGKILSTSTVSSCEVIEVDANSAALLGLDAVIISQALKVETNTCAVRETSNTTPSVPKRRTTTPPLLPRIKTESESEFSSSSSSSSLSSSLVGTVPPQSTENLAFSKEKTVYLSPKLKQLLQTQDSHRPTPHAPRLSLTPLSSGTGRFKRRTASPSHSPQQSPVPKGESSKTEEGIPSTLKMSPLESHDMSPVWSRDKRETTSPPSVDWSVSRSGGNPCNQQPLDLSAVLSNKNDCTAVGLGEAVLDLSISRKISDEPHSTGGPATQVLRKRKPNTSMLEKVLMKEYGGLEQAGEEVVDINGSPVTHLTPDTANVPSPETSPSHLVSESTVTSVSPQPPPPSLTPVILNPPSPSTSTLASPTPPPPVLPTVPSPLSLSTSSQSESCGSPAEGSHAVLLAETSPGSVHLGLKASSPLAEAGFATVTVDNLAEERCPNSGPTVDPKGQVKLTNPLISQTDPKTSIAGPITGSESVSSTPVGHSSTPGDSTVNLLCTSGDEVTCTGSLDPVDCDVAPTAPQGDSVDPSSLKTLDEQLKAEVQQQPVSLPQSPHSVVPGTSSPKSPSTTVSLPVALTKSPPLMVSPPLIDVVIKEESDHKEEPDVAAVSVDGTAAEKPSEQETFCRNFVCNVCEEPFCSMKELRCHIVIHAEDWPFKCEFCVQLFGNGASLLEHRSALHGVGRIYVCCVCNKEFAFLCNLQQHQLDLHPGQSCTHTVVENGKLRPQNFTDPTRASADISPTATDIKPPAESSAQGASEVQWQEDEEAGEDREDLDDSTEELYTTIKIMASEGGKQKGSDVRLGINQHYPSFKPPPFPYHNRTPAGSVVSATNFTTHNIPQTFSTAIRCTKCGKSFDNMPELHKHILSCASASDKRRYTPKKNPVPLRQVVKPLNGALSPTVAASAERKALHRMGQPKRLTFSTEPTGKTRMSALNKKKNQLVQKALSHRNRSVSSARYAGQQAEEEQEVHVCPHCKREFTYRGSLNKHVAVSCPMKPTSKEPKKGSTDTLVNQDRNGNLRRRTADSEIQQQVSDLGHRTLGKTRTRSSGLAEDQSMPVKNQPGKGKPVPPQVQPKRPASSPATTTPLGKKSRTALAQQQPPHCSPATAGGSTQRPAARMQRGNKEGPPKKVAEAATKLRERTGGPVTRSLQLASRTAPEGRTTDDHPSQEHREPQVSSRLVR